MNSRARSARRPLLVSTISAAMHDSGQQQLVGRALVGRDVVCADTDAALQPVLRYVESAECVDARQQFVDDHPTHQLLHDAAALAVEPGKVGHAAGRAHAAEEAVAFHQQRVCTAARGGHRSGDAGRAAAEHHDIELAVQLGAAGGFVDPAAHAITAA
jgi:hypothetical protein